MTSVHAQTSNQFTIKMRNLVIHLISDSSGQDVKYVTRSALSRFNNINVKKYYWTMIHNEDLLKKVLFKLKKRQGIVIYTIHDEHIRNALKNACLEMNIPCISPIRQIIGEISKFIDIKPNVELNLDYNKKFNDSYFDKVEAIEYALKHDDGKMVQGIIDSDIILFGASRTSKTPTSIYLAYNGFKTANVPYVYGLPIPEILNQMRNKLVVGLVINPSILIEIREARMKLLGLHEDINYTDINIIQKECSNVKRICNENSWSIVDISMRSIEETSALIMQMYYEHKKLLKGA